MLSLHILRMRCFIVYIIPATSGEKSLLKFVVKGVQMTMKKGNGVAASALSFKVGLNSKSVMQQLQFKTILFR